MGGQDCLIRLSQVISYIVFACDNSFTSFCLIFDNTNWRHIKSTFYIMENIQNSWNVSVYRTAYVV
jgi:hypothetical protein